MAIIKMDASLMKTFVSKRLTSHLNKVQECKVSRGYFDLNNDILKWRVPTDKNEAVQETNGLRKADNRIPHNFHKLLTEQAVSYGFTVSPQFDVDDNELNERIREYFEADGYFGQVCTELALEAIHFSVAYLHYWSGKDGFDYAVVPGEQVIPVYSGGLKRKLEAILRYYLDEDDKGNDIVVYEYWNSQTCTSYHSKGSVIGGEINEPMMSHPLNNQEENVYHHGLGRVPFIPFYNGYNNRPNLYSYKGLIDAYDAVFSGFINDVEDLQELVLVLTNYGGTDLDQFRNELKEFKAIKIDQMDDQDKSGVQALEIQIPTEARDKILELLKVMIWDAGQGFRPTTETITATSGVALDQMYSSLELKVKLMEVRFREGFSELIKVYLDQESLKPYNETKVKQDWRRNRVKSMIEMANTIAVLSNVTSKENLAKNNPLVPDWQAELAMKEKDDQEAMEKNLEMQKDFSMIGFSQSAGNFSQGKKGSQSQGTLEPNNPSNNSKKIRKQQTGKGVGNE